MDNELHTELKAQRELLEAVHRSVEQTRGYLKWTLIMTVLFFVLPLLGLFFIIPAFITSYTATLGI